MIFSNGISCAKSIVPPQCQPSSCTIIPRNAIIQIRPCLISTARRRGKESTSSRKPSGSQRPSGPFFYICIVWKVVNGFYYKSFFRKNQENCRIYYPFVYLLPGSTPRPSGERASPFKAVLNVYIYIFIIKYIFEYKEVIKSRNKMCKI